MLLNRYAVGRFHGKCLPTTTLTAAVVPIFRSPRGSDSVEQAASGVLLKISSTTFLLTAAHVTDELERGQLHVPGKESMIPANGSVAYRKPQLGASRETDKIDLAYMRLSRRTRSQLHDSFRDLTLRDISYKNDVQSVPFATFAGYPVAKARKWAGVCSGELVTYTGHVYSRDLYERLGYTENSHICIRMRLRKTFSSLHERRTISPRPIGVSGGAVLSWPQTLRARCDNPTLRLIGIAHTFHESEHCLAGTHIKMFIKAIVHNNPELRPVIERALERASRSPLH